MARTFDPLVPLLHPINYQVSVWCAADEKPMAMDLLAIGEGGEVGNNRGSDA